MMEEYSKWCDSEANEKEDAITSAKRTIGDLEEELVETVDSLERATTHMKRNQVGSFLQQRDQGDLKKVAQTLGKIIEASWVSKRDRAAVQALVQSAAAESDGDEDLSLTPQASTSSYESHGGGILEVFEDMKTKAEETLSDARTAEMKAQHSYEMLKQSLDTELDAMNKRMSQATTEKSGLEEAKASAEEQLAATQTTLADDKKYLAELQQSCSMKAAEWATRQKDAVGELAAIAKAKEVLESGVKVFLQVSNKAKAHDRDVFDDKRERVDAIFSKLSQSDHSFFLTQLRSEARAEGSFDKVKGLIESMIARLEKQAAEEADAKAFCDTETSKSKAKQAALTAKSDMHAVRIEKATAGIDQLKVQIKSLQEAMAAMDSAQAEATALRQKEHAEYEKASSDYKLSAEAVANAIAVLQQYYSQGSFVQSKQAPEFGSAKSDISGTIVEMLEVAESDFTSLLAEAEASEKAAQAAFDKLSQENEVARAANVEEVRGKENEVGRLDMSLLNYKEDHSTTANELDAVLKYLDELKPQCETKVMSYAERKARREAEISGLKEALEILSN